MYCMWPIYMGTFYHKNFAGNQKIFALALLVFQNRTLRTVTPCILAESVDYLLTFICQHRRHTSPMPTCSLHGSQAFITIQFMISYSLHTGGENGLGTRLYLTYISTKYRNTVSCTFQKAHRGLMQ